MRLSLPVLSLISCIFLACKTDADRDVVISSNGERLSISVVPGGKVNYLQCQWGDSITSTWPLRYPVYKFVKCDVNNDGQEDLAVGVIKATRNDPNPGKRLFLFQVKNRSIIPLWLGSSLSQPLEDFAPHVVDSTVVIRSIEVEKSQRYLVAEYEWFGFGLSFRRYLKRELSLDDAHDLLDE